MNQYDPSSLLPMELAQVTSERLVIDIDRSITEPTISRFIDRFNFALERVKLCTNSLTQDERDRVIAVFENGEFDENGVDDGGETIVGSPLIINVIPTTDPNVRAFIQTPPVKIIAGFYACPMQCRPLNFAVIRTDIAH